MNTQPPVVVMYLHVSTSTLLSPNSRPACSVLINTDELLRSFVVLRAPHADKLRKILPINLFKNSESRTVYTTEGNDCWMGGQTWRREEQSSVLRLYRRCSELKRITWWK